MANDTVQLLAEDLLATAVDALTCSGIEPPDRQLVTHGLPAWDCEQISVHVDPAIWAPLDTRQQTCQIVPRITLNLTVVRCWPTQEGRQAPTATTITDAAAAMNADLWVLMRTFARHQADGTLFEGVSCQSTKLGPISTLQPSGGFAAWQMAVIVQPTDTDPLCGS